jgi:hypothetical protein
MNYTIENVHISLVKHGDTVMHDGEILTVDKNSIRKCPFMGRTLFGDCYRLGTKLVQRVNFKRFYRGVEIK